MTFDWYMHPELCECGKSYFVVSGVCNRCGAKREKPRGYSEGKQFSYQGRDPKGRGWDKKQHRVI